jgi:hypothetical protein
MPTKTLISSLPDDLRELALAKFAKLADEQRGKPERLGGGGCSSQNPILNATGLWTWQSEHIGDLTHRMAQRHCENIRFGQELVADKVRRGERAIGSRYGFKREVEGNLNSNFKYRIEMDKMAPDTPFTDFVDDFKKWAGFYADAHAALTVYNEAQWHAREAAVSLGRLNYDAVLGHLRALHGYLETNWEEHAGSVYIENGEIVPYTGAITEALVLGLKKSVPEDCPSMKFMAAYKENTQTHPMLPANERLFIDTMVVTDISLSLRDRETSVHLGNIRVAGKAGGGNGSKTLAQICAWADEFGVTIEGTAKTYTDTGLKLKDLISWYKRNGFSVSKGNARDGYDIFRAARR